MIVLFGSTDRRTPWKASDFQNAVGFLVIKSKRSTRSTKNLFAVFIPHCCSISDSVASISRFARSDKVKLQSLGMFFHKFCVRDCAAFLHIFSSASNACLFNLRYVIPPIRSFRSFLEHSSTFKHGSTHGRQQLSMFYGFYGQFMYNKLSFHDEHTGQIIVPILRPSNSHSNRWYVVILKQVI